MRAVAIAINIFIASRYGLAPVGTAFEVNMINVGTSVNNVSVNTLTAVGGVEVLVEVAEVQGVAVGDTGEAPRSVFLEGRIFFEGVDL
jgi:hypothetical protein